MSTALRDIILQHAAHAPLTLAHYMELALQHPQHGYYRRHDPLGAAGDFITAPEISQMFGELIGLWCADYWLRHGSPAPFTLCELGPGRGTLLADALRATRQVPGFHAACRLALLESNATLRAAQADRLDAHAPHWLNGLDELPSRPTLFIANEFFDALPIRQFMRHEDGWRESCVTARDGELAWAVTAPDPAHELLLTPTQRALTVGNIAEISVQSQMIIKEISSHISHYSGALLAIDYGAAAASGQPTLQALAQHRMVDPLAAPGEADLTAHVDFGALAATATAAGAYAWSLMTQGDFLNRLGLPARHAQLAQGATPAQRAALDTAAARLTGADAMGTLFKVLCVTPNAQHVPAGWPA